MKRHMLLIGLTMASLWLLGLFENAGHTTAGEQVTVRIEPVSQDVAPQEKVSVDVLVENVQNLAFYEFRLAFDQDVLEYQSLSNAATFLESTGGDVFCYDEPKELELAQAIIRFGCSLLGNTQGPSGTGKLVTITFSTRCSVSSGSDLVFVPLLSNEGVVMPSITLRDDHGRQIQTDALGGKIEMSECSPGPPNLPTATASPTVRPTATPVHQPGDVNCDQTVDALDATLILQQTAGLLGSVPCLWNADVNADGSTNPLDAALLLQYSAGFQVSLILPTPTPTPQPTHTPTPGPTSTSTPRPTFTPPPTVTPIPTSTSTPAPMLSAPEAIALAYDWLTSVPPSPLGSWSIDYSSCSASWIHVAWEVSCEGTRLSGGELLHATLEVCVFEKTQIVTPLPCQ